jgi:hypothetical protein
MVVRATSRYCRSFKQELGHSGAAGPAPELFNAETALNFNAVGDTAAAHSGRASSAGRGRINSSIYNLMSH